MRKITSLSNKQFQTLIVDKRELKRYMKHPQNEKIEAGWANISGEQLQEIPSGAIYLTQSSLGEGKPQVLLVSTDENGQKQAKEQGNYQEDYKQELLQELENPSEEAQYQAIYKQQLLSQLGITQEKPTDKESSRQEEQDKQAAVQPKAKEETPQEKEQRLAKMREFEQKHSFDQVYKLKKEVLKELKGLTLTDSQREKLTKLEKALDTEKKDHDQQKKEEKSQNGFVKFFARKNGAHSKTKQQDSHEVER